MFLNSWKCVLRVNVNILSFVPFTHYVWVSQCASSNESKWIARFSFERSEYDFSEVMLVSDLVLQHEFILVFFFIPNLIFLVNVNLYSASQLIKMCFVKNVNNYKLSAIWKVMIVIVNLELIQMNRNYMNDSIMISLRIVFQVLSM